MLYIVATPIGNYQDITVRALDVLKSVDLIIGEERKEVSKLCKFLSLGEKPYELLNEHSTTKDVEALVELCRHKNVALVSDCGTPVFCDPGAQLVELCRKKNISMTTLPGASSLMGLLSLSSARLNQFVFEGFLPAEKEARQKRLSELKKEKRAVVLMDTPYRLEKLLSEIADTQPERKILLVKDLTLANESTQEGKATKLLEANRGQKAEFLILLYPA